MPFVDGFRRNLLDQRWNQVQPLLVSNRGRWIWCDEPFGFEISATEIVVEGPRAASLNSASEPTLRAAVLEAGQRHFPPTGSRPGSLLFTRPQYNTWIELQYQQRQDEVLRYAHRLLAEGYPPGVLMIDDSWQKDFGRWAFDADRFPDPAALVAELHELGFEVMLWVSPQVSPDGRVFLDARDEGRLIVGADGRPVVREWWNGYSALLDMTNPRGVEWLRDQLNELQRRFGIDGFKFDAGDFHHYRADDLTFEPGHPARQSQAWAEFAEGWPLNELRASWKMGNRPLAQRLRDKTHGWDADGLGSCLPNVLAQALVGYPFSCPDMVGGGEYAQFNAQAGQLDGEIFVRHAQLAALLPMQQFSAAPWRLLSADHARLCLEAAQLHVDHGGLILQLADRAAQTGEPIVRPLTWVWNADAAAGIRDQFLLGDDLLVAPVVEKGARRRKVLLPPGVWQDLDGRRWTGPGEIDVAAPLDRLPRFLRQPSPVD